MRWYRWKCWIFAWSQSSTASVVWDGDGQWKRAVWRLWRLVDSTPYPGVVAHRKNE